MLNILTSSRELLELLQKVDAAYHSKPVGPSSYSSDEVHKYVPSIREQLLVINCFEPCMSFINNLKMRDSNLYMFPMSIFLGFFFNITFLFT